MSDEIIKWLVASVIVEYAITILIVCHISGLPLYRVPLVARDALKAIFRWLASAVKW